MGAGSCPCHWRSPCGHLAYHGNSGQAYRQEERAFSGWLLFLDFVAVVFVGCCVDVGGAGACGIMRCCSCAGFS